MRNLKRALSLALAAAMLISLMVVGASATSYNDQDAVSQAEAVQLLTDLGIVGGDQNGNYNPTATLTRAEFTVMMSNLLNGSKFDTTLFSGTDTPFTDVQGHWAAPYIAYCYSAGVIAGTSATTFSPDSTLTAAQAAAILLMALGYNQNNEFAANNQFALNVTAIAQKEGLYQDLSVSANAGVSRENVAQMIKNALFMPTQEYLSVLQIYQDEPALADSLYNGLTKVTATLAVSGGKVAGSTTITEGRLDNTGTLITTLPTGLTNLDASSVDSGKSVVFYVDSANKLVSTDIVVTESTGIVVPDDLTNGVVTKAGTALNFLRNNDLDATTTVSSVKVNYFDNTSSPSVPSIYSTTTNTIQTICEGIPAGDLVTMYDTDDDGVVEIINVIHKSVAEVSAAPVVKMDNSDGKEKVSITGLSISNVETAKVHGYQGLAKDDIVLYYQDAEGNYYIEKAATITGNVTGSKGAAGSEEILLNGTYYGQSALGTCSVAGTSVATYISNGKFNVAATAYLDNNGNIIAIDNDVETASNYAVVLKTAWVTGQGVDANEPVLEARILLADGTTTVANISKIGGYDVVKTSTQIDSEAAKNGQNTTTANSVTYYGVTDSSGTTPNIDSTVFKYLVKNGEYELTVGGGSNTKASTGVINTNDPTIGTLNDVANASTTYVYHDKDSNDKDVYTVYTGYANAPKTTGTSIATGVANGFAKFVYVDATAAGATVGGVSDNNYLYVLDTTVAARYVGEDTYYEITGVLNGDTAVTTVLADSNTITNLFSSGSAVKGLFVVTLDDNGYVTGSTATKVVKGTGNWVAIASTDAANGAPANGVLKVDGTNTGTYTYDGTEHVYIVDTTNGTLYEATMDSILDDDKISVEVVDATADNGDQLAVKTVYVERT